MPQVYVADMGDITELLGRAREGDERAVGAVFDALYDDLRQIARSRLRVHPRDVLLDTAGVVNDCYLDFPQPVGSHLRIGATF